jgi:hypothetical protein
MADCPFCKAAVSEEISRFGGHCSSCLIEIPGEEAATDAGVGRPAHAQESPSSRGPLISGLVAAAVVLVSVGVWHSQQQSAGEQGPARSGFKAIPLSSHEDQTVSGATSVATEAGDPASSNHREERSERRNLTGGQAPTDIQRVVEGRVIPKAAQAPLVNPLDAFAVGSGPRLRGPQGIVLTDEGQIESMVGRVLERGNKRLQPCYQQHGGGAKSSWQVSVDIGRSGAVESVSVSALSGSGGGLRRCIQSQVRRWTFQRIAHTVSSGTIYRFGN